MYIKAVDIDNFKCFKPYKIDDGFNLRITDLSKLNIFIGKNNAGKSTVLAAIKAVVSGFAEKTSYNVNSYKFNAGEPTNIYFKICLHDDETKRFYKKDAPGWDDAAKVLKDDIVIQYQLNEKKEFNPYFVNKANLSAHYKQLVSGKEYYAKINDPKGVVRAIPFDDIVTNFEIQIQTALADLRTALIGPSRTIIVESSTLDLKSVLESGDGSGVAGYIFESLQNSQIIDKKSIVKEILHEVQDFLGLDSNTIISPLKFSNHAIFSIEESGKQEIPITFYGQGTISILLLLFYLKFHKIEGKPLLLLIDEPENSLHPALQKKLLRFLEKEVAQSTNLQIFIATQSPFFIDNADMNTRLYRVDANDTIPLRAVDYENRFILFNDIGVNTSVFLQSKAVLLVEGVEEMLCLPILLMKVGYDIEKNNIVVINMGGDNMSHCNLGDILRLNSNVVAWIDGEKNSVKERVKSNRIEFKKKCDTNNIPCMLIDKKRSTVNIIPKAAIERYYKIPIGGLIFNEYDDLNKSLLVKGKQYSKPMEIVKISNTVTEKEALGIDELRWLKNELEKY